MTYQAEKALDLPLKVAVTEDDAMMRERVLLPGLRDFGFKVDGFGDAAALYRGLLAQTFDVVILDIALPNTSARRVPNLVAEVRSVMMNFRPDNDHIGSGSCATGVRAPAALNRSRR